MELCFVRWWEALDANGKVGALMEDWGDAGLGVLGESSARVGGESTPNTRCASTLKVGWSSIWCGVSL